jgi:hypothetical protein
MKSPTAIKRRHFVHKHPLFKRQRTADGIHWKDSVYYYWWEFLRLNPAYKKTCEQQGKGKYASLYVDFGDVHAEGFKTWWSAGDRGAKLFAEAQIPTTVTLMSPSQAASIGSDIDPAPLILIAIPLSLPKAAIKKRINAILRTKHTRKRGQRLNSDSTAKYRITRQFSIRALKSMLQAYELRQKEPKLALWEIGQRLELGAKITEKEFSSRSWEYKDKKRVLASAASRKLKQAERIIAGVVEGHFPEMRSRPKARHLVVKTSSQSKL